jgi:hypothetical protein
VEAAGDAGGGGAGDGGGFEFDFCLSNARVGNKDMGRNKAQNLGDVIDLLKSLPDDMFEGIRDTRPPEEREGLVEMFAVENKALDKELGKLARSRTKKKLP